MKTLTFHHRRGMSINEVMVAMGVIAIGVSSIIAMFPLGYVRVQQSMYDTRCTLMAQQAAGLLVAKQMPNDPQLWRWDLYNPVAIAPATPNTVFDQVANNVYAFRINPPATLTQDTIIGDPFTYFDAATPVAAKTFVPFDSTIKSYPILVDPFLVDPTMSGNVATAPSVPRTFIDIGQLYGGTKPYADIRVESLAELTGSVPGIVFPSAGPATLRPNYAAMSMTRWFTMQGDIEWDNQNPVLPHNSQKMVGGALDIRNYVRMDLDTATNPFTATAIRSFPYSWAFMIQRYLDRDLDPHVGSTPTNVSTARPELSGDYSGSKIRYLCFHRRNLQNPYTVAEGCFLDGSTKVTLSWPTPTVARPAPVIRRGTWLMEASISTNTNRGLLAGSPSTQPDTAGYASGNYNHPSTPAADRCGGPTPNAMLTFRREFEFYRVVDYSEPEFDSNDNRFYQVVQVSPKPTGYPKQYAAGDVGDLRGRDPYTAGAPSPSTSWPINVDPSGGGNLYSIGGTFMYYPVVIFDGLLEVF